MDIREIGRRAGAMGFWMKLNSPFEHGSTWVIGFTPLSTSGWNGAPDHYQEGSFEEITRWAEEWLDSTAPGPARAPLPTEEGEYFVVRRGCGPGWRGAYLDGNGTWWSGGREVYDVSCAVRDERELQREP